MKRFFLGLVLGTGVPIALIAIAWSAVFIYWHVKLSKAVRVVEEYTATGGDGPRSYMKALGTLRSGGCRSLPHLLATVHPSQPREFVGHVVDLAVPLLGQDEEAFGILHLNVSEPPTPEQHAARCEAIRSWWARASPRHHQWWRVWSSSCRVGKLDE